MDLILRFSQLTQNYNFNNVDHSLLNGDVRPFGNSGEILPVNIFLFTDIGK